MKESILIVDDETGIREGCRRVLVPEGFVVQTAASIKEAQHLLQEGNFDMVLLDIMMPDGRGIDLIEPIHKKDPDAVCIIITGYATVEMAVDAIKRGAYNFISKPFTSDMLIMTVNQGLEKRRLSLETKRLNEIEQKAQELAQAKEDLERLDQFKSNFILTITHELRSPVSGAQSLVRTLIKGLAGDVSDIQKDVLIRIENRLDNLADLVDDLLSLAETKSTNLELSLHPVEIDLILSNIIDNFSVEATQKGVQLKLKTTEGASTVFANESGLQKIFNNLIQNAIKYTPSGGEVKVAVKNNDQGVFVTVSDTGLGIPTKDIPHIGEEFYRAGNVKKAGFQGTGLGLSIVYQYMRQFNASIDLESQEGKGTTFTLFFPKNADRCDSQTNYSKIVSGGERSIKI
jgi:signal transduction histidine kinase